MNTQLRDTSRQAYDNLRAGPVLGLQAKRIESWVWLQGHDCSLTEISRGTGIAINAVSGRVNDCKKVGVLVECEKRPCRITGRQVIPVDVARASQLRMPL